MYKYTFVRNTNLTTMWNSGLTYGANFDFKTGGYLKVGNLVVVALSLNIKSDIAETSYVDAVFDLPLPIVEAALAIWTFNTAAANLNKCRIMPYNNGGLVYVYGALSKGEELQISGAYISAKCSYYWCPYSCPPTPAPAPTVSGK